MIWLALLASWCMSVALCALLLRERFTGRTRAEIAFREYRIALEYIREECAVFPHEFAAVILSGNVRALRAKFPDYADFHADCIRQEEGYCQ